MAQKITVYWRDIPTQINVKRGRSKGKALLPQRFHEAVDKAAMRAGMGDTDSYVQQWRQEIEEFECDGDLDSCAIGEMEKVDASFPQEILEVMISNGGVTTAAKGS